MQLTPQQDQARKKAIEQALTLGQPLPTTAPTPPAPTPSAPTLFPAPNPTGTAAPNQQPVPVKPMSMDTPGYGAPSSDPGEAYLQQHPMAGGTPPTPFTPETGRHALIRGIFAGMSEFGRPGAGFAQNAAWDEQQRKDEEASRNWPMQRQKNIDTAMDEQQKRDLTAAQTKAADATVTKAGTLTTDELAAKLVADAQKSNDPKQLALAMDMAERLKSMGKNPGKWTLQRDPTGNVIGAQSPDGTIMPLNDPNVPQGLLSVAGKNEVKPPASSPAALAGLQAGPQPKTNVYDGKVYPDVAGAVNAWAKKAQDIYVKGQEEIAKTRGEAYGGYRGLSIIDPETGQVREVYTKDAIASGAAPSNQGTPLLAKEAQMAEIKFASQQAREAIEKMPPLDAASIATLTLAMRESDPTVFARLKDTLLGSKQLTPDQQAFVTWILQLNERAMSLRNIAGMGQGAQDLRAAIQDTLPGIKSGNKEMMVKQLDAFDNQVRLLEQGIPKINHPAAPQIPAKGTFAWDEQGMRHEADGTTPLPKGWTLTKPGAQ